ncbi:MAG TPA: cupin domain-containing protein [Solirubrobacteraceae bacterium]|jgi:mannose-6-phosphate isomerase-like protein (cupin superfamily)
MSDFTRLSLTHDVENMAPKFGMPEGMESRFARTPLHMTAGGLSYFRLPPGVRVPFGHRHGEQEEVYVVVEGSARMKIEDEVVELARFDAVRVPGPVTRGMEGGPEGAIILAFGAPNTENKDAEMIPGWWDG